MTDTFFTFSDLIDLIISAFPRYAFLSIYILYVALTTKTLISSAAPTLTKTTQFGTEIRSSKQSVSGVKAIAIL